MIKNTRVSTNTCTATTVARHVSVNESRGGADGLRGESERVQRGVRGL